MFVVQFLCLAATIVLVTANPLYQAIPTTSCSILEPNIYRVCRDVPSNIPVTLQRPSTSFNPYSQSIISQSPVTYPSSQFPSTNQQLINDQQLNKGLSQQFLNNILSNPTIRNILNPNTKLYNQNGIEVNRLLPSGSVPNVINNYIIVPPELLLNNTNNKHDKGKSIVRRRKKNSETKPNEARLRRKENLQNTDTIKVLADQSEKQKANSQRNSTDKYTNDKLIRKGNDKSRRRLRYKTREESSNSNDIKKQETNTKVKLDQGEATEPRKSKSDQVNKLKHITIPINNYANNMNRMNYRNFDQVLKAYQSKLNETAATQNTVKLNENQALNVKLHDQLNNIQPGMKEKQDISVINKEKPKRKAETNKVRSKVNVVQRNPRDEAVIQDFRKKFPGIPDNVVRNLMSYLKTKLHNEQLGSPNFYYPQYPLSYQQLYQKQFNRGFNNNGRNNNNNNRRKNRRNKNKRKTKNRNSNRNCGTVVELNPTIVRNGSEITSSTANGKNTSPDVVRTKVHTGKSNKKTIKTPDIVKLDETSENATETIIEAVDNIEKTTLKVEPNDLISSANATASIKTPELSTEDIAPTIYANGIIDDYYPDFKADNEAQRFINNEYDRHHYTTDKNYGMEDLDRDDKSPVNEEMSHENDDRTFKNEEIETTLPRPDEIQSSEESEEIQFRTPPKLEMPDFETKKVERFAINEEENAKMSTFSNTKIPYYNTKTKSTNDGNSKRYKNHIETHYARSKVVKYGQTPEYSEEGSSTPAMNILEGSIKSDFEADGDTTLIIAQSIPVTT